ncbi:MAG: hypothetical protein LBC74_13100 [Planctomycetaceae bacterium]|jgi:hypothetical protein|nr:hypothetical protein [Planctomycetaceae bacterium]
MNSVAVKGKYNKAELIKYVSVKNYSEFPFVTIVLIIYAGLGGISVISHNVLEKNNSENSGKIYCLYYQLRDSRA